MHTPTYLDQCYAKVEQAKSSQGPGNNSGLAKYLLATQTQITGHAQLFHKYPQIIPKNPKQSQNASNLEIKNPESRRHTMDYIGPYSYCRTSALFSEIRLAACQAALQPSDLPRSFRSGSSVEEMSIAQQSFLRNDLNNSQNHSKMFEQIQ